MKVSNALTIVEDVLTNPDQQMSEADEQLLSELYEMDEAELNKLFETLKIEQTNELINQIAEIRQQLITLAPEALKELPTEPIPQQDRSPAEVKEIKPKKPRKGVITSKNVTKIIENHISRYPALKILQEHSASIQAKVLKRLRIRHESQMINGKLESSQIIKDEIATALTGTSPQKGSRKREVSAGLGRSK